jgi:hypothetical protein
MDLSKSGVYRVYPRIAFWFERAFSQPWDWGERFKKTSDQKNGPEMWHTIVDHGFRQQNQQHNRKKITCLRLGYPLVIERSY